MTGIVALIEATPRSPADGSAVPVRLIYNAVGRADFFGEQWHPAIDTLPTFETNLAFDGTNYSQGATPTVGAIGVAINAVTAAYGSLVWHNAAITLWVAPRPVNPQDDPVDADFAVAWTGRADAISEQDGVFSIVVLDTGQALRKPLQPVLFGSSGSALLDGTDAVDKAGQPVPMGWGELSAVPGILVDKTNNIWLIIGRPAAAIVSIEDGGAPFTLGVARATLADLQADVPADGAADYCLDADGLVLVRPWTAPTYPLIVDLVATGGTTPAQIASTIVAARSALAFAPGVVAAFDALYPSAAQLYAADGKTVAETLDLIFPPLGAYWRISSAGAIDVGRLAVAAAATRDLGYVLVNSVVRKGVVMPTGRRTLGYATNNRVLSTNEIAQSLTQDNADALGGIPAATIMDEIAAAAAAATAATTELAAIASDGVLTPATKAIVIRDADVVAAEQAKLDAQALAFAIVTEKATYDAAVGALTTYLGGLVAPTDWNDLTGNTAIDGPTFRGKFAAAFDARTALLTAIAAAAASWPNQSGYGLPADFADVTAANIAAGIVGQGALATMSSVGAANLAVAVGGRNLMRNSSFDEGSAVYLGWSPYNNAGAAEPTTYSLVPGRTGGQAIQMSYAGTPTTPKGIYLDGENTGIWYAGADFVWSFYARSATGWATLGRTMAFDWNHPPTSLTGVENPPLTSDWQRYVFRLSWTAGATVDVNGFIYVNSAGSGGLVLFDDMQIEEGDVATGYTPLTAANAAQLAYQDGETVEALQPAEAAANVTGSHTAAAIAGQGPLATSGLTAGQVANSGITISAGGALAGAGGGAVTFGGLGGGALGLLPYLYFGSPLLLSGAGVAATDPNYQTAQGTAAAIAGQGFLATNYPSALYPHPDFGAAYLDPAKIAWTAAQGGNLLVNFKPQEAGANVTELRTAAAISGQAAWATYTGLAPTSVAGQVQALDPSTGNMTAQHIFLPGVAFLDAVFPAQLGADKTSTQTAAAISGQSPWATYGALAPTSVAVQISRLDASGYMQAGNVYLAGVDNLANRFPAEAGADATGGHTAAAIAGQGGLATKNRIILQYGDGGLANQANTVWLLDIHIITINGTAAGIAGQGSLATANTVDYATQITGKPANANGAVTVGMGTAIQHYVANGATVEATAGVGASSSSGAGEIYATLLADGTVFATGEGVPFSPGEPVAARDTMFSATFTNSGAGRVVSFTSGYTKTGGAATIDNAQSFLTA